MLLRYDNFFYAVSPWRLFKRCCAQTTFSTLLHYDYFSTLLRHVISFHTAALWLLFLRCCAISTLSTMLRHVYFFHAAAPYLFFPRCCAVSSLSTLLRYVYFFHAAAALDPLFHDWQNYVLTRTVDIKSFLANYYRVRWASQFPMIGLALFFFYFDHLSFQWANSETLIRRRGLQRLIRLCTVRLCS